MTDETTQDTAKAPPAAPADATDPGVLSAVTTSGVATVPADTPMPQDEPGHTGAALTGGVTPVDPNAMRRMAEGRGPGLQDSERISPASWGQGAAAAAGFRIPAAALVEGLRRELEGTERAADAGDKDAKGRLGEIRSALAAAEAELDDADKPEAYDERRGRLVPGEARDVAPAPNPIQPDVDPAVIVNPVAPIEG